MLAPGRRAVSQPNRELGRRPGVSRPWPDSEVAGRRGAGATPVGRSAARPPLADTAVADTAVADTAVADTAVAGTAAAGTALVGQGRAAVRIATRTAPEDAAQAAAERALAELQARGRTAAADASVAQPWYAEARTGRAAPGYRDCGVLEGVLTREWAVGEEPVPEAVTAVNRLADLPLLIKEKLAAGLDGIHVGAGGVPDLDHMGELKGVPLPSGRATWDACAGAYGDRKIIIGSRPSPTPDVTCHEVGHALDDLDSYGDQWQSDSPDFQTLYDRCLPHLASDFHRHSGTLGRREFFADAFAAIASSQRPALVEMLSGDTRSALDVMLYFNIRYGV